MKKSFLIFISCFSINAQAACDIKSLIGSYVKQMTYTTYNTVASYNNGSPTICGDVGIITFDGKGTAIVSGSLSCIRADIRIYKATGSYNLDGSCSGEIRIPSGGTIKFVLDKALKNGVILGDNVLSTSIGSIFKQ